MANLRSLVGAGAAQMGPLTGDVQVPLGAILGRGYLHNWHIARRSAIT
jgi:hypothetical protein